MGENSLLDIIGITGYSIEEEKKNQIRFLPHNIYRLIPGGLKSQVKTIF